MNSSQNNWKQYQNLLEKYISLLINNPYVDELREDFNNKKIERFTKFFTDPYKKWIYKNIELNNITIDIVDKINITYMYNNLLEQFSKYMMNNIEIDNYTKLKSFVDPNNLDLFKLETNNYKVILKPTPLRFVTTTAICFIDTDINFKELYNRFIPPDKIRDSENSNTYNDKVITKIVGCKTGNLPIKGYFKKETLGDFYNCATINVVINKNKDCNVKIFNNGKLQMTGIPMNEIGHQVCDYICNEIKILSEKETSDVKIPIVLNKKRLAMKSYKTVMINTCYEIGKLIDRESLFKILLNKYKLNTIYDSEGYPGVRIEYYYIILIMYTENEAKCTCSTKCKGKGSGMGDNQCRKISIAIFQSGSAIIAGGCTDTAPIYAAYKFINTILQEDILDIIKSECEDKKHQKKIIYHYIEKKKISNPELYDNLKSNSISLKIS